MGLKEVFLAEYYVLGTLYNRFGPLGVLCRLSGQFPVHATISEDSLILKFSFCSVATLYSFVCQALPLIPLLSLFLSFAVASDARPQFDTFVATIFIIYLPQIIVYLKGWESIFQHLQDIDIFDSCFHSVSLVQSREVLVKPFKWLIGPIFQLSVYIVIELTLPTFDICGILIRIMFYLPSVLQTSLFLVLCQEMSHRTSHFQRCWLKYLRVAVTQNLDETTLRLDSYRSLQGKLLKCTAFLNAAFGARLTVFCVFLVFVLKLCTYLFLRGLMTLSGAVQLIVPYTMLIFVGLSASNLHSSSHVMLDHMFDLRICGLNKCLRTQMDILAYQLYLSKMNVSVPGLFVFSRRFVGSFVIVLVSYFVVVTQVF